MDKQLKATFEIYRSQILLSSQRDDGSLKVPESYFYALMHRMHPYFHQEFDRTDDPFINCYSVTYELIHDVITYLDDLWIKKQQIPTFYDLETKYGRELRCELIIILRYCYLNHKFDSKFFSDLLTPMEHPSEASGICQDFSADDLMLF